MRFKQARPQQIRFNYRQYPIDALTTAYQQCKDNKMPVKRAAKIYNIPVTTLRDRVLGKIDPETLSSGKGPLFSMLEEGKLAEHFKTMASYGYGYTRQESVDLASDFAFQLGKRGKDQPLTLKWMRGFLKRWPELKVLKPRGLEYSRARMASESTVISYFNNLKHTLELHGLIDKPHLIFNLDEKGITTNHKPPYIVGSASYCPQAVTSGKGKTTTVLGCGSASGVSLPPFFVFAGKRMNPDLLEGKSPGAAGVVSETGWSNQAVFREYLTSHFLKHIPGRDGQKVLLIVDGHKSHISVSICEWALEKGIILFILPAHTSHILQPMDVSCYGPFERMYNAECHKLMRQTQSTITRYNVCEVACRVYAKALSVENVQSAFKRTGIYPFNPSAVPQEYLIPAQVYFDMSKDSQETVEGGLVLDVEQSAFAMLESREKQLKDIKTESKKKPRKVVSKIVAGKEIDREVVEKIKQHEQEGKMKYKKSTCQQVSLKPRTQGKATKKKNNCITSSCLNALVTEPQPGPSHINLIPESDTSESEIDDAVCCVCELFTPAEVSKSASLIFAKWAQCDGLRNNMPCNHWVHLIYCTPVRVIRLGDKFYCPHCKSEE